MNKKNVIFIIKTIALSVGFVVFLALTLVEIIMWAYYANNGEKAIGTLIINEEKMEYASDEIEYCITYYANGELIIVELVEYDSENYPGRERNIYYLPSDPTEYFIEDDVIISIVVSFFFCIACLVGLISGIISRRKYTTKTIKKVKEVSYLKQSGTRYRCTVTEIVYVDRKKYIENITPITFYCQSNAGVTYKCEVLYSKVKGIKKGYLVDVFVDENNEKKYYVDYDSLRINNMFDL